jgi:hypothetical protein
MWPVFPRYVAVLSLIAALFGALDATAVITVLPAGWGAIIAGVAVVTAALSHELQREIAVFPSAPKLAGIVSILAGCFGALTSADVLKVLPEKWGAVLLLVAALGASLSKALGNTDAKG